MEVYVYLSLDAKRARKPVFGRVVTCPDAFDVVAFSNQMKAILGRISIIKFILKRF